MIFIGKYNKSVILTYVGITIALTGIIFSFLGNVSNAMICLIFSGICDLFDGKIARACKRDEDEKEFGKQLDSLADVFLFLGQPCAIGINLLLDLPWICYLFLALYTISGVIRLAWFNMISSKDEPVKYFTGVPVAYIALFLPIVYTLELIFRFNFSIIYLLIYIVFSFLFIFNIKIAKPKGMWYVFFFVLAIIVTIIIKVVG